MIVKMISTTKRRKNSALPGIGIRAPAHWPDIIMLGELGALGCMVVPPLGSSGGVVDMPASPFVQAARPGGTCTISSLIPSGS